MGTWDTTTHDIAWFAQQKKLLTLDLDPAYQRDLVWPLAYKIFLMDTVINNLSVPKVYMETNINEKGETIYKIADGKQRLSAIFDYLDNKFALDKKYAPDVSDELDGATFNDLPLEIKKKFYSYKLTVDELKDYSDKEMKAMFVRLNKNNERLSKQELRNATYSGDFIELAEALAENDFWHKHMILSQKEVRRMKDVEFVSELLAMMDRGIMDKTKELNEYYSTHEIMEDKEERKKSFMKVFDLIKQILPDIETTRFKQKGDYYSLFFTIQDFIKRGYKFNSEKNSAIRDVLIEVSQGVSLKSAGPNEDMREYQNLSTQSSDSAKARKFRANYLSTLIEPFLIKTDEKRFFTDVEKRFIWHRAKDKKCVLCKKNVSQYADYEPDHSKPWNKGGATVITNGQIAHTSCNRSKKDNF